MANAKGSLKCAICQGTLDDHHILVSKKILRATAGSGYDDLCDALLEFFVGRPAVHRACPDRLHVRRKTKTVSFFED